MKSLRVPTILDVNPDNETRAWEDDFIERLELHVESCAGPEAKGGCPLLLGRDCPLVDHADGILFQLDLDSATHREILRRYNENLDVPIRVVADREHQARYAHELADVEVVVPPVGPASLDGFAAEVESEAE